MTTFDFNKLLQDAKAGGAWPIGDYDFEVVESDAVMAQTGSPMIKAKLRCLVGPYAGKHVTNNFVLSVDSPNALNIFFRHMAAFGLPETYFAQIGTVAEGQHPLAGVAPALRGRRARLTIGHRTWQGTKQNDITAIQPITEGVAGGQGLPGGAVAGIPTAPQPGMPMVPQPPVQQPAPVAPQPAVQDPYAAPPAPPYQPPPPQPVATPAVPPPPVPAPPQPPYVPAPAPPAQPQYAYPPQPQPPAQEYQQPPAGNGTPPPGYSAELWASIPDAAKQQILAQIAPPPPALPV